MGWYLDDKLACPFVAECIRERRGAPLKMGECVTVTSMLDDEEAADSHGEMQVEIEWQGRTLGVPLAQLRGVGFAQKDVVVFKPPNSGDVHAAARSNRLPAPSTAVSGRCNVVGAAKARPYSHAPWSVPRGAALFAATASNGSRRRSA